MGGEHHLGGLLQDEDRQQRRKDRAEDLIPKEIVSSCRQKPSRVVLKALSGRRAALARSCVGVSDTLPPLAQLADAPNLYPAEAKDFSAA